MITPATRLLSSLALLLGLGLPSIAKPTLESLQKPPPTLEQIWEEAHAVVYGTAVRIQIDATNRSEIYDSTFRVERCWKGDLKGDVLIEGGYNSGCYISPPFRIRESYLVLLQRLPGRDAYEPWDILAFRLSPDGTPLPERNTTAANPFSLFGGSSDPDQHRYDERALSLFEFAERMAGHEASAQRAQALLRAPKEERERAANEAARKAKEEAEFLAAASTDFETARKTENLASRKSLLLALRLRLKDRFDNDTQELKGKIFAELSVIDTLLANGVKTNRPNLP